MKRILGILLAIFAVVGRAGQTVSVESPLGGTATGFAVRVQ